MPRTSLLQSICPQSRYDLSKSHLIIFDHLMVTLGPVFAVATPKSVYPLGSTDS